MISITINKDQINQFNENGFLVLDNFINKNFIRKLLERIDPLFRGEFETGIEPDEWNWKPDRDPKNITRQICNAWKSDKCIRQIICHKLIGKTCSTLMGWDGARLLQDNILWKPPNGKSLLYHQDAAYDDWIIPQTMASCWMTLDSTSKETGTLEYVKGSHKWGLSPPLGEFHAPKDYKKELNNFVNKNKKKINIYHVEIPAGGVAFHHGMTWHGSGINRSKLDRRALVAHCVPSNAIFHPTNCGGTGRIYKRYKKNDSNQLDDSFFPLLWSK